MLQKATTSICAIVKKMYIKWIVLPATVAFLLWIKGSGIRVTIGLPRNVPRRFQNGRHSTKLKQVKVRSFSTLASNRLHCQIKSRQVISYETA